MEIPVEESLRGDLRLVAGWGLSIYTNRSIKMCASQLRLVREAVLYHYLHLTGKQTDLLEAVG